MLTICFLYNKFNSSRPKNTKKGIRKMLTEENKINFLKAFNQWNSGVFEFNKKTSPIDLTDVIETRDTVQNFKNAVNSYKGVEIFKTPAGDLIILKDCQAAKGKKRGDVFLMSFGEFTAAFSYAEGL